MMVVAVIVNYDDACDDGDDNDVDDECCWRG